MLPELNVTTAPTEIDRPTKPVLPKPKPLELREVEFKIIELPDGNLIALTPRQYENLSLNMAEILRYIRESDQQLEYYRGQGNGQ